jgi:hypothetical protein
VLEPLHVREQQQQQGCRGCRAAVEFLLICLWAHQFWCVMYHALAEEQTGTRQLSRAPLRSRQSTQALVPA